MYKVLCCICREEFPFTAEHRITMCKSCHSLSWKFVQFNELDSMSCHQVLTDKLGFRLMSPKIYEFLHEYLSANISHVCEFSQAFESFMNNLGIHVSDVLFGPDQVDLLLNLITSRTSPSEHCKYVNSLGMIVHRSIDLLYCHTLLVYRMRITLRNSSPKIRILHTAHIIPYLTKDEIVKISQVMNTNSVLITNRSNGDSFANTYMELHRTMKSCTSS